MLWYNLVSWYPTKDNQMREGELASALMCQDTSSKVRPAFEMSRSMSG